MAPSESILQILPSLAHSNLVLQGTKAMMDIRRAQRSTKNCIKKAPFGRLCRDIAVEARGGKPVMFTKDALEALLAVSESYLTEVMRYGVNIQCDLTKKPTLTPEGKINFFGVFCMTFV